MKNSDIINTNQTTESLFNRTKYKKIISDIISGKISQDKVIECTASDNLKIHALNLANLYKVSCEIFPKKVILWKQNLV